MAQVEVTSHVEVFLDHDVVLDSGMVFPPRGRMVVHGFLLLLVLLGFSTNSFQKTCLWSSPTLFNRTTQSSMMVGGKGSSWYAL